MKIPKLLLAALLVGVIVLSVAGCSSSKTTTTVQTQTATVTRGDISNEITAAGNLELSTIKDLTFELFYAKGTVASVNVSVGQTVTKGEVLASLDQSEWDSNIQTLQDALTATQRDVTTKQRALATAQRTATNKQNAITAAQFTLNNDQLAVTQAQLNITSANITLNNISDIKLIQDKIDHDNFWIQYSKLLMSDDYNKYSKLLSDATADLAVQQAAMAAILGGNTATTTASVALLVAQDELALQKAQMALQTALNTINSDQIAVTNAQQDLTFAQQDVTNAQSDLNISNQKAATAQKTLDEALADSPDIVSPIDGFVTKVNNAGGDQVLSGAIIIQVADPNQFDTQILISESDILSLKLGNTGTVEADAVSGVAFPVKVTYISPTATISSSVVNYSVKVILTSLTPVVTTSASSLTLPSGNFTMPQGFTPGSGNFTRPSGTAVPTLTDDQKQRMQEFLAQQSSTSTTTTARSTAAASSNTTYTLKSGMTVTVTLTIPLSTNVLLVPSNAVTTQGNESYVTVMKDDGTTEKVTVITGNTDSSNTEITSGLTEGEKVVISSTSSTTKSSTKTTATTTNTMGNQGGVFFGGGPG
jgi:multidrug efflux pump subunit AcrA (membrane-fusion protein)